MLRINLRKNNTHDRLSVSNKGEKMLNCEKSFEETVASMDEAGRQMYANAMYQSAKKFNQKYTMARIASDMAYGLGHTRKALWQKRAIAANRLINS
jgi:hypothetical protein